MSINSSDTIGGLARSIFCDSLLADAAIKIDELHVENTTLEPILEVLRTIQLYNFTEERNETIDVDISSYEEDDFYIYKIENTPSLSYKRLKEVGVVLSGIGMSQGVFLKHHYATNDDNAVTVESILGNGIVRVNWLLENYHGSISEVQQADHYLALMGLPVRLGRREAENKFIGTTIKLDHIKIDKLVINRAIINIAHELQDDFMAHLKILSLAFPDNANLSQKAEEFKVTRLRNQQLVSSRDLFQTFTCTIMDHVPFFQLKLKSGCSSTMQVETGDMIPCWDMRPEPNSCPIKMPLCSLSNFTFHLGNIPAYSTGNIEGACGRAPYGTLLLNRSRYLRTFFVGKYQTAVSTVIFSLDESINEFAEDEDIHRRIQVSTMSDEAGMVGANGEPVERLPERVTVQFILLQVNLQTIKSRLDLLQIPIDINDEETKEDTVAENNNDNN
eukprot:CAMPEP_0170837564 /NCGR_PEP_ID=MMETSP0734-20130129/2818_1 /TAXON_ID=186038 /ORGANISM="Fragilariopsis kerguelensis, Strain L26-C5" /LENGTH=445 /DNA_ID=CAMNT_0011204727 /DNA_START=50 /DNA_END=1388 /DNA_ORIENTATION=+